MKEHFAEWMNLFNITEITQLWPEWMQRQLLWSGGTAILFVLLLGSLHILILRYRQKLPARLFLGITAFWGGVVVWGLNFAYIWETPPTRFNSVFKLYYHVWILWAFVAAAWSAWLWQEGFRRLRFRRIWQGIWLLSTGVGLLYPIFAFPHKLQTFQRSPITHPSLDGGIYLNSLQKPLSQMRSLPLGIVVEYPNFSLFSSYGGQIGVLGWISHERSWRGEKPVLYSRYEDIENFYGASTWEEMK